MKKLEFKNFLPHIGALLLFIILSCIYFKPVFSGKALDQSDITHFKGMSKEIADHRETYHEEPLWTNSMFGGMPAYQISVLYKGNLVSHLDKVFTLGLPHPVSLIFLYFLGFYILMLVLKIDSLLGIFGSIGFAFSSFFFIIIVAGHNSQAHAIGYMAPVLAGVILCFRGRYLWGGLLTALFLTLEIWTNHPQITYYLLLVILIYGITEFFYLIKSKNFISFFKTCGVLIAAMLLAVMCNLGSLWGTYNYGKETTRGRSDLTINPNGTSNKGNVTSGLDKDYATQWSYGKGETMTLMIPDFKGGSSGPLLYEDILNAYQKPNSKEGQASRKVLDKYDENFIKMLIERLQSGQYINQYWGDQPFTSGPVYAGAIIVFLSFLALFFVEGRLKWALFFSTILAVLLAWGNNFMGFTEFFMDYFPGYNKFRTVSMTLVIAELTLPILAVLAIQKLIIENDLFSGKKEIFGKAVEYKKLFYVAFALTGGLCLLYYIMPGTLTDFFHRGEKDDLYNQVSKSGSEDAAANFINQLEQARESILRSDAFRSFILILIAAFALWGYFKQKINTRILIAVLILCTLVDMWLVDKRYLNDKNFVSKSEAKVPYKPTAANLAILEDKDPDYRVLNLAVSPFQDASTSYFHKSIGGYHGAKLKRYQELCDFHFNKSFQAIIQSLQTNPTQESVNAVLKAQSTLNMLNTRYIIINPEAAPLLNPYALGNAWFVKEFRMVENADKEILALNDFDPAKTAIIDQKFKDEVKINSANPDSSGSIRLTKYKANQLNYESNSTSDQLAVFSEIYYKDGWNAYIDGKLTPHLRADYILRAMVIPAGKHQVEFRFEPANYKTAEAVSLAGSILLFILFAGSLALEFKKSRQ